MSAANPDFEPGAVVRVKAETMLSEVVLPATRKCELPSDDLPELLICCAPVALVRTPVGIGILRWVELKDLTAAVVDGNRGTDAAAC
ncbi:hypothetical protein ABIA35_007660 [Catenulispora sp. MAP12-49]|uniref:hypothetical protein n=1 Tax=Catenulispora sp. MAP12-49 TaxID=3156302 RepID=UPI003516E7BF